MVFKGRFFSSSSSSKKSSDSSSPSNSPRHSSRSPSSFGSPLRSASKKSPKKPDSTSPSSLSFRASTTPVKDAGSPAKKKDSKAGVGVSLVGKSKKPVDDDRGKEKDKERDSVAPILASSLGLNKIKTRSGPLPQESFYGFRGGGTGVSKGVALGASNLSRPSNSCSGNSVFGAGSNGGVCGSGGTSGDRSSSGKKVDKDKKKEAVFGSWVAENGGSSPGSGASPRHRNSMGSGAAVLGVGSSGFRSGELLASGAGSFLF